MAAGEWSKATEAIANGGKTLSNIYHKCTFTADTWSGDHVAEQTKDFNFAVNTDFTIIINTAALNITNSRTWVVKMMGSGDGETYSAMQTFATSASGAADDKPFFLVYDYDSYGRAPYMRLELDPSGTIGSVAITVGIIPH